MVDVAERRLLCFDEIAQHTAGGPNGGSVAVVETKALQVGRAKMLQQHVASGVGPESPGWPPRQQPILTERAFVKLRFFARQAFGRIDAGQFVADAVERKAGCMKAAGGEVDPSQSGRALRGHDGGQIVARARVEQGVVRDGSGADDPRHLAPHEALGLLGVFDLIANRDAKSGGDQFAEVTLQLMIGKARHRHGVLSLVAAG